MKVLAPLPGPSQSPLIHTTPFPNILLDEVMPHLKDTEWRVLCTIVRQTCGWQAGSDRSDRGVNKRKRRDWLTREQLKLRTGRDSEALAKAVDMLVKMNYILAESEDGQPLSTPGERRAYRARVYYGLTPRWALLTITSKTNDVKASMPPRFSGQQSPVSSSFYRSTTRQSELEGLEKANITKENRTKENVTKRGSSFPQKQTRECRTRGDSTSDSRSEGHASQEDSRLEILARQVFQLKLDSSGRETDLVRGRQAQLLEEPFLERTGVAAELSSRAEAFTASFTDTAKRLGKTVDVHLSPEGQTRLEKLLKKHKDLDWRLVLELFFQSDMSYIIRRSHSLPAFLNSCYFFLPRIPNAVSSFKPHANRGGWRKLPG